MSAYSFPTTSHSYFGIVNLAEEKARFLTDDMYVPHFRYDAECYNLQTLQKRRQQVRDPAVKKALDLVIASVRLQQGQPSLQTVENFQLLNSASFSVPAHHYVDVILNRIAGNVTEGTEKYWLQLTSMLPFTENKQVKFVVPEQAVFTKYRDYFERYSNHGETPAAPLPQTIEHFLRVTGKTQDGWKVHVCEDSSHARVNHRKKQVRIGRHYQPRTPKAALRIAVHEVYGHVVRGSMGTVHESEGFAVVLEQLLDTRFRFRRSYRYLAIALGWGVYGKPMTFRQVHEVLWRLMIISSCYSKDVAKEYAFHECVRAFRGGRPDLAVGAVYLKDAVYFASNIAVWQRLTELDLAYGEFVDMIEGRRKAGI